MNTNSEQFDEATLPASGDAVDEVRAEAARVRSMRAALDPSQDPTTMMARGETGLGDDPTVISFDAADEPTMIVVQPTPATTPTPRVSQPPGGSDSLIEGKTPPATSLNYWDRNEIAEQIVAETPARRAAVPRWFLAAVACAVLVAVVTVLIVMYLLSGSST